MHRPSSSADGWVRTEQGIAMLGAIIIIIIIGAIVTAVVTVTISSMHGSQRREQQLASLPWAETAISDLEQRTNSYQIGKHLPGDVPITGGQLWDVPLESKDPKVTIASTPLGSAYQVSVTDPSGGAAILGFYQICSPVPGEVCMTGNANKGFFHTDENDPRTLGAVDFVVRGWSGESAARPKPTTVRIMLADGSLARFALVTDDQLNFATGGTMQISTYTPARPPWWSTYGVNPSTGAVTINGVTRYVAAQPHIHSNNADGFGAAIKGSVAGGGPRTCSSRTGSISIGGCSPSKANTNKTVEFAAFNKLAFQMFEMHAAMGYPQCDSSMLSTPPYYGIACVVRNRPADLNSSNLEWCPCLSAVWVQLIPGGLQYKFVRYPGRRDIEGGDVDSPDPVLPADVNMLDDTKNFDLWADQTIGDSWHVYTPPPGGGAIMFPDDVFVEGRTDVPITIVAKHLTFSRPVSIFILPRGGIVGGTIGTSLADDAPVGLVAEDSVHIPSFVFRAADYETSPVAHPMDRGMNINNVTLENVAIYTNEGSLGIGSTLKTFAYADKDGMHGSLKPNRATQNDSRLNNVRINDMKSPSEGYGRGDWLRIRGAVAVKRAPILRYQSPGGGNMVGFQNRSIEYTPRMSYNPPPMFPSDIPWSMVDFTEVKGS